jgi:glycosyltransferase involved in cell wall biosynthesis
VATRVDLVIAGDQGTFESTVRAALRSAGIEKCSRLVGHVDQATLAALYTGAECLLFTSAYEGFGLPPVEAMACGTPVALFDNSSLPEVAGPASLMVADGDAAAMAAAVARLLGDPRERAQRSGSGLGWAARFTWKRAAEATLAVYERALRPERTRQRHV